MNLERFARTMVRRRWAVLGVWIGLLVGVSFAAATWGGPHRVDYSTPGSDSAAALQLLDERMPETAGDTAQLVFVAPDGVESDAAAGTIAAAIDEAGSLPHVAGVFPPTVSEDGTAALAIVQFDTTSEKVPVELGEELTAIAERYDSDVITVEAGGAVVQYAESGEAGSEQIGMIAALIVLLLAFGSVVAAGLPLVTAIFGVGVALGVGQLLNHIVMVPDWAPALVSMIGIGVGIDYALFIVVRYRAALQAGASTEDAVVEAIGTSGRAVVFAGGTVVISLLGLCAMGMDYLYGTAAVTVAGVLIVVVASMTLLPAMLGILGHKVLRLRVPGIRGESADDGLWARWSRVVQHRPIVTGTVALVVLLLLAAPFGNLRFGYPDAGNGSDDLTSRRAFDIVTDEFGPGVNAPLVVAVDIAGDPTVVDDLTGALASTAGVAAVMPATVSPDGSTAAIVVLPTTGPQSTDTEGLIEVIRADVVPTVATGAGTIHVGGLTASQMDESDYLGGRLPWFIGAVIGLSFVLLLVVFRSVLVAVKAAVMNLLAIGASYGIMAVALSGGRLGGLLGIDEATPIPTWAPMMMFALLFGLSMDYEVFLLSRIREEYRRTGDNAGAVATGIAQTGRVISAAAAIMVTVFGAFVLSDDVLMKVIGLGLASAVLLDATIVRMVLVPSTMELLGDRNWWLPAWLDRLFPNVEIEHPDDLEPGITPKLQPALARELVEV
jgi:RND superfamily putative drug exporter